MADCCCIAEITSSESEKDNLLEKTKTAIKAGNIELLKNLDKNEVDKIAKHKFTEFIFKEFKYKTYNIFDYMQKKKKHNLIQTLKNTPNWQTHIEKFESNRGPISETSSLLDYTNHI